MKKIYKDNEDLRVGCGGVSEGVTQRAIMVPTCSGRGPASRWCTINLMV